MSDREERIIKFVVFLVFCILLSAVPGVVWERLELGAIIGLLALIYMDGGRE